jgi:hypothetical protein
MEHDPLISGVMSTETGVMPGAGICTVAIGPSWVMQLLT